MTGYARHRGWFGPFNHFGIADADYFSFLSLVTS